MSAPVEVVRGASPSARSNRLRLVVGLLISAGAIYVVVSSAGGFASSLGALGSARRGWLAAGLLAEAASYAAWSAIA